ncbi:MAG: glycoside hydrolase family 28 protein [Melioribacteraceae bacterium]|nr:glycoside hydrolase family 28 protein [Melioribacteraceae bacterium]
MINFFNKLKFHLCLVILLCSVNLNYATDNPKNEINKYLDNLPFEMGEIRVPEFPDYTIDIRSYGAVGDGFTLNTKSINNAIFDCSKSGGGKVVIPEGIWFTGPVALQSNVNLHLEKGAVLLFSSEFEDYPIIETSWEGSPIVRATAPLSGRNLENIAITGEGIIDGSGDDWRPVYKYKMSELEWNDLIKRGGVIREGVETDVWWPSDAAADGKELVKALDNKGDALLEEYAAAHKYLRPVLVSLIGCKRVLLDGPTFQNSPAWNIHLLLSEEIVIRNISVRNPWYSSNGDGLDLESCKNVLVYNSTFDVGDDAICIKSGRNEYGRNRGVASENIAIEGCIVYHSHGAFTIGSEMSGSVRNISLKNSVFLGTDVGLRFKSTRGRGGVVENIFIDGILMENIIVDAIRFNMFYDNKAPMTSDEAVDVENEIIPEVTEGTPSFRKIFIKNLICKKANRAIFLQGLPEMNIKQIVMENISISAKMGFIGIDMDNITMKDMKIITEIGPAISLLNSKNIEINNVAFEKGENIFLDIAGKKTSNIVLKNYDYKNFNKYIKVRSGVNKESIIY